MKGLYIKDFKLMMNQKMFFIVIAAMAIFFAVTQTNIFFVISYATFIAAMFVISSISYDEFNNGNAFLFTLPVTRTGYVKEKYLFAATLATVAWLAATILSIVVVFIQGTEVIILEWFLTAAMILLVALMMVLIIIPVQLKFGQSKGNVAMLLVMGGAFAIGYLVVSVLSNFGIDVFEMIDALSTIGLSGLLMILLLMVAGAGIISYLISCKIMTEKEF